MYDYNMAKKLMEKQIQVYEGLLALVPSIIETIRKFDGKMVNKRIETALQSIKRGISFQKNIYSGCLELTATEWDDRSVSGDPDKYGYSSCNYVQDYQLYLADSYRDESFVDESGRLNAEKLTAQIERRRNDYQNRVNVMKEQFSRIDSIIEQYKQIQELKRKFTDETDYSIREYFGLKV